MRQRIKGPALAAYYPRKTATVQHIIKGFGPDWTSWDEKEVDRLEKIEQCANTLAVSHDAATDDKQVEASRKGRAEQEEGPNTFVSES